MSKQRTVAQTQGAHTISRGDLLKQGTKGAIVLAAGATALSTDIGTAAAHSTDKRFNIVGRAQQLQRERMRRNER